MTTTWGINHTAAQAQRRIVLALLHHHILHPERHRPDDVVPVARVRERLARQARTESRG